MRFVSQAKGSGKKGTDPQLETVGAVGFKCKFYWTKLLNKTE